MNIGIKRNWELTDEELDASINPDTVEMYAEQCSILHNPRQSALTMHRTVLKRSDGRIDIVCIKRENPEDTYGVDSEGKTAIIPRGQGFEGQCLARLYEKFHCNAEIGLVGKIVCGQAPWEFSTPLEASQYILYSYWTNKMRKKGVYPTTSEIAEYFDIDKNEDVVFLRKGSTRNFGRVIVHFNSVEPARGSYQLVQKLRGRLFIAEREEDMKPVQEKAKWQEIAFVHMEPLRSR